MKLAAGSFAAVRDVFGEKGDERRGEAPREADLRDPAAAAVACAAAFSLPLRGRGAGTAKAPDGEEEEEEQEEIDACAHHAP